MRGIQKKFFDILDERVSQHGMIAKAPKFELVVKESYANTGEGFVQRLGELTTLSQFTYGFHDEYATFTVNGPARPSNLDRTHHVRYRGLDQTFNQTFDDVIAAILKPVK